MPEAATIDAPATPAPAAAPAAPPAAPPASFDSEAGYTDLRSDPDFNAAFDTPGETVEKAPNWDRPADQSQQTQPAEAAPDSPQPIEKFEETPAEEPAPAEAADAAPETVEAVEYPEPSDEFPIPGDVRVETTRDGKKQYIMPSSRFNEYHQTVKALRDAEAMVGEPITQELLEEFADSRQALHNLEAKFLSSQTEGHNIVLSELAAMSKRAIENGDSQYDALATLAQNMPDFLQKNNPLGYQVQAQQYLQREGPNYLRNVLANLVQQVDGKVDDASKNQFAGLQHIYNMLYKEYPLPGGGMHREQSSVDPLAQQRAQLEAEKQAWQRQQHERAQQTWNDQIKGHETNSRTAIDTVVTNVLKPVAKNYSPEALSGLKTEMRTLVNDAIQGDARWQQMRSNLVEEARMAASEQRRQALLDELVKRYEAKAKTVLDIMRNPTVRKVLNQKAAQVVAANTATVQKAQRAAAQRQPSAGGATPQRSILPPPPDKPGTWSDRDVYNDIMNS